MADRSQRRTEQLDSEQRVVDALYEHLDAERLKFEATRTRAMHSPVEGAQDRGMRDAELARLDGALARLQRAETCLCFGRVDSSAGESLHIGRTGLRSESGEAPLVDWRAEAARPFYAATPATPCGVRRRRHLRLQGRRVVDISDEILDGTAATAADVIGDGPLIAALSGTRTGRMRQAVATLQREQDAIVRSEHRGVMVVDGGPGTGKTIVALHRAAYVLYAFPEMIERGVLVFGPNKRFLDYISRVLPSLGEGDVELATTQGLVGTEASRSEPDAVARAKGRRSLGEALARRVLAQQPHGVPLRLTTAHGSVVLDASRVDATRSIATQGGVGHNRARDLFLEYVVDDLVNELQERTAKEITSFEEELKEVGIDLDRMFPRRPGEIEADDTPPSDDLGIDWDHVRDDLLDDAGIDRAISEVWPRLRAEDVVRELLTDPQAAAQAMPELSVEQLAMVGVSVGRGWSRADLVALDEARTLIDGPPGTIFGHIVVDEAQLLSEMEWQMLMRRCPSRSMTIVGDLAQAGPTATSTAWQDALGPFVADRFVHHTLTINYRTTAEILDATVPVLARIAPLQRLSRSIRRGEAPTHLAVADADIETTLGGLLAQVREEGPDDLVGIIAASQRVPQITCGSSGEKTVVVPASDARGLEFDTVIIIDPAEIEGESVAGLRDLYVAQTRATKRLFTLTTTRTARAEHPAEPPRDVSSRGQVPRLPDRRRASRG
ncbi:MAG: AAA family ATPase [Quadrisphaera sp.]